MAYSLRIFSRGENVPTLVSLNEAFEESDIEAKMSHAGEPVDMTSQKWTAVDITYHTDRRPVIVERYDEEGDVRRETRAFLKIVKELDDSPEKLDVISHLDAATQVYVFRVPTEDIIEDGWRMMSTAQQFFVESTDGLLQVDGEGFFYLDEDTFDLLLEVEE